MRGLLLAAGLIAIADGANAAQIEQLIGVDIGPTSITYQVHSGGCTAREHFTVRILESDPLQLQLIRNRPDLCRAFVPYGKKITFTYAELGLSTETRFRLANGLGNAIFPVGVP